MAMCEDFPCCGHERGDCDGSLYGSDESIMSSPHVLCDHETGYCEVEYDDDDEGEYCKKCGGGIEPEDGGECGCSICPVCGGDIVGIEGYDPHTLTDCWGCDPPE